MLYYFYFMQRSSLSWLSLKRLEQPVFIEQEMDRMIIRPEATNAMDEASREVRTRPPPNRAKQIKAEKVFLKRVINNSHWHQLVEQRYRPPGRNIQTEQTKSQKSSIESPTQMRGLPLIWVVQSLLGQVHAKKKETSIPELRERLRPFFQDVGQLGKSRYRSVAMMRKLKERSPQTLSVSQGKRGETSVFKVHQIEWRSRLLPSFEEVQSS